MKLRDQISKKMRTRAIRLWAALPFFALPLVLARAYTLGWRPSSGIMILISWTILLLSPLAAGVMAYIWKSHTACPGCGNPLEGLSPMWKTQRYGIPKDVKFCPYCAIDFDTPVEEFEKPRSRGAAGLAEEFPELAKTE